MARTDGGPNLLKRKAFIDRSSLRPESRAGALTGAIPHQGMCAQCARRAVGGPADQAAFALLSYWQVSVHSAAMISFLRPVAMTALTNSTSSQALIEARSIGSMLLSTPLNCLIGGLSRQV